MLFGSYRRGDANDPDAYVTAIAAVLSRFDAEIIREVTDPSTGIAATEKYMSFMPNAGELKVYCDGVAARKERIQRLGALPAPDFSRSRLAAPERQPGDLATVFVPDSNPRYRALVEWSKTANPRLFKFDGRPGIVISYDTWDQRPIGVRRTARVDEPSRLALSAETLRVMAQVDAERRGDTQADQYRDAAE